MPDPVKDLGCEVMFSRTDGYGFLPEARLRSKSFAGHASAFFLRAAPREARRAKRGGARRDRTDDLMLAKHALSQLSYGPVTRRRMLHATIAVTKF